MRAANLEINTAQLNGQPLLWPDEEGCGQASLQNKQTAEMPLLPLVNRTKVGLEVANTSVFKMNIKGSYKKMTR